MLQELISAGFSLQDLFAIFGSDSVSISQKKEFIKFMNKNYVLRGAYNE